MFFSSKKKGELILILDVQSSLARSILFLQQEGAESQILFTHGSEIPYREGEKSDYLVRTAIKSVSETVQASLKFLHSMGEIDKDMPARISEVHYVLSSPWMLSKAKKVTTALEGNKIVDKALVMQSVQKEREKMTEGKRDVSVVEEKIFEVEINGYPVADWLGKKADKISISFVTSVAGAKMIEKLKQACEHIVRTKDIHFHSSLLLQHIGLANIYPDNDTYTMVRVHGELTDIAAINKHSCTFFGTYPIGTRTMMRSLAKLAGVDSHAAQSMMNMHMSGAMDDSGSAHSALHANMIKGIHESWIQKMEDSLKSGALSPNQVSNILVSAMEREKSFIESLKERYSGSQIGSMPVDDATLYTIALGIIRPR